MSEPAHENDDAQETSLVLAKNVREAREAVKLNQTELARRSGLARSRIHRIETARDNNSTLNTLVALARGLGLPPTQAFRLLTAEGLRGDSTSTLAPPEPILGNSHEIQVETAAIELPRGEAFDAAHTWAAKTGKPVMLIDPKTRRIIGIAGVG